MTSLSKKLREQNLQSREVRPLVYSCSGCSNVAQIANQAAVELDREGVLEMSCIAGVGGDVPALVRTAKSGRVIAVVDGCSFHCAQKCLSRHGVSPHLHLVLTQNGYRKVTHGSHSQQEVQEVKGLICQSLASRGGASYRQDSVTK